MWMQYPHNEELFGIDDQYLIGSDLLVKPVTEPGVSSVDMIFPAKDSWFDVDTMFCSSMCSPSKLSRVLSVEVPIEKIPVYQRGGSIIARKLRLRRSSNTMTNDPYTLYIALDHSNTASGTLYMDDEHTFDHEVNGEYGLATFSVHLQSYIRNEVITGNAPWMEDVDRKRSHMIERIIVMGVEKCPCAFKRNGVDLEYSFDNESHVLVIRKPDVSALMNWEIDIIVD